MTETRNPLTRQRSEWLPVHDDDTAARLVALGAADVWIWRRNVHDGRLTAVVADEPMGWHLSISHSRRVRGGAYEPGRYPTWDEIANARYELLPEGRDYVMHLPPPAEYVAVHDTTFHLHEHPARDDG